MEALPNDALSIIDWLIDHDSVERTTIEHGDAPTFLMLSRDCCEPLSRDFREVKGRAIGSIIRDEGFEAGEILGEEFRTASEIDCFAVDRLGEDHFGSFRLMALEVEGEAIRSWLLAHRMERRCEDDSEERSN